MGGEIICNGNVDLHVGAEMSGGSIYVHGNAAAHAGREMSEDTLKSTVTLKNLPELLTLVNGEV